MAKKQFKAESKRLLDLMINSIYTNKEIFLRELISNASDALDKRHFVSLTDKSLKDKSPLEINISVDKENRTLTISDTGIGMNKDDLENNLGVIAKSGSDTFKAENKDASEIIGQFGVGFYSAFMVANKISVESRKLGEDKAYLWQSSGPDGYTVTESDKEKIGTIITLYIKEDTDDYKYSDFLDTLQIQNLVRKYSDYIRYPIHMDVETTRLKEGSDNEYETITENKTLNSMIPLWKRKKKDITKQEYNDFYQSKFYDYSDPLKVIHYSLEGNVNYNALLFIPSVTPFNYYSPDYKSGVQLYSKGVFIMEDADGLVPDYFKFIKGIIDSDDISLNISRELLQEDKQLKSISKSLSSKIKGALVEMVTKEREDYIKFFENFGSSLKYGIYNSYGINKDELQDLLIFKSSKNGEYVTLKEYCERMKEDQKNIYYVCGDSIEAIEKLPQMEKIKSKDYEVLYFLDRVDEFMVRMMNTYNDFTFQSVSQADLDLDSEEEKKEKEEIQNSNKSLLDEMKSALKDKVSDVRLSNSLVDYPVCLSSDSNGISFEMEKTLQALPQSQGLKATRILEINPHHELFKTLQNVYEKDKEEIGQYADLLYQQALLIEGFALEDPVAYSKEVCDLLVKANKSS